VTVLNTSIFKLINEYSNQYPILVGGDDNVKIKIVQFLQAYKRAQKRMGNKE
jgi:hypothetical protein